MKQTDEDASWPATARFLFGRLNGQRLAGMSLFIAMTLANLFR
ncbi:hypothetical protein [Chlorobium sp.]|nr:hypothetical protein [Chlorobium sp.]